MMTEFLFLSELSHQVLSIRLHQGSTTPFNTRVMQIVANSVMNELLHGKLSTLHCIKLVITLCKK